MVCVPFRSPPGFGNIPTFWSIVQTGDYNGDGISNLLWRDNLGNTAMWFMNGTTVASSAAVGNIPTPCTVQSPSVRQPEHLMLARPRDRRVEQAGDADPVRQSAFDGGFDEARREEGQ
jgi:hypothetical protein